MLLIGSTASGAELAEFLADLGQKSAVDPVCGKHLVNVHHFQNQAVIGRLCLISLDVVLKLS